MAKSQINFYVQYVRYALSAFTSVIFGISLN
jgi:hypothetical protein